LEDSPVNKSGITKWEDLKVYPEKIWIENSTVKNEKPTTTRMLLDTAHVLMARENSVPIWGGNKLGQS
jgi:hypothetical protein